MHNGISGVQLVTSYDNQGQKAAFFTFPSWQYSARSPRFWQGNSKNHVFLSHFAGYSWQVYLWMMQVNKAQLVWTCNHSLPWNIPLATCHITVRKDTVHRLEQKPYLAAGRQWNSALVEKGCDLQRSYSRTQCINKGAKRRHKYYASCWWVRKVEK